MAARRTSLLAMTMLTAILALTTSACGVAPSNAGEDDGTEQIPATRTAAPVSTGSPAEKTVKDDDELSAALRNATPGSVIELSDGVYEGQFSIAVSGTPDQPITLRGDRGAVLDGEGVNGGKALEITGSHWRLEGFTIRNARKGVLGLGVTGTELAGLKVYDIGDEAVHFQQGSSGNVVRDSVIHDTGKRRKGFGEGIAFGTARTNWENSEPDRSDRNKALNNKIGPNVTAEPIDVREGTSGGEIRGNTFDGTGQSGENAGDSWVNLKGNGYFVADNKGTATFRSAFKTRTEAAGFGCGNAFRTNSGTPAPFVLADGWAFDLANNGQCEGAPNVVCADNTIGPAGRGVSIVPIDQCRLRR